MPKGNPKLAKIEAQSTSNIYARTGDGKEASRIPSKRARICKIREQILRPRRTKERTKNDPNLPQMVPKLTRRDSKATQIEPKGCQTESRDIPKHPRRNRIAKFRKIMKVWVPSWHRKRTDKFNTPTFLPLLGPKWCSLSIIFASLFRA